MPHRPDPAVSPTTFAQGLTDRQLHCRELGHTWRPLTATYDKQARVFDRSLRCSSCRTVRNQVLSRKGEVLSNSYVYPKGYLAQNVDEHPGVASMRATFRLEAVHRFLSNVTQIDTRQNGAA